MQIKVIITINSPDGSGNPFYFVLRQAQYDKIKRLQRTAGVMFNKSKKGGAPNYFLK